MPTVEGRVLYRIMLAAVETETTTDREACILGAIVRSLTDIDGPKKFWVPYVLDKTLELCKWGRYVTGDPARFPTTPLDQFDIGPINARFRASHKETRTT